MLSQSPASLRSCVENSTLPVNRVNGREKKQKQRKRMRKSLSREVDSCYHGTLARLKSTELWVNLPPPANFPSAPPSLPYSTPFTCPRGGLECLVEHIHERCSRARQGWRDTSSWMLGSREEALKLAPAWVTGTGEWGREGKGGSVEEEQIKWGWEICRGEGMLGGRGGRKGWWQHTSTETPLCTFTRLWQIKCLN